MADIAPIGIDQTTGQSKVLTENDTLVDSGGDSVNQVSFTLTYGGTVTNNTKLVANGTAGLTLDASLDLEDQFVLPSNVSRVIASWHVASSGGTLDFFRNSGTQPQNISTSAITGTQTFTGLTWSAGDRLGVGYRGGTLQGQTLIVLQCFT